MNLPLPQYLMARDLARGRPPRIVGKISKRKLELFMNMSFVANKVIKACPAFRESYGMEEVIEQLAANFSGTACNARRTALRATHFAHYLAVSNKALVDFFSGCGGASDRAWTNWYHSSRPSEML